jgi:TRAP-type transport system periplasmic protein
MRATFVSTRLGAVVSAFALCAVSGFAQAQPQNWKIGTPVPPRNIMATFINPVIEGVAEKAPDALKIDYHHDFNEQAMTDQLIRGRLQMAYMSATGVGVAFPEAAVLNTPYLWNSPAERDYVTDKHVEPILKEVFRAKGVELVRIGEAGWTSVYCKSAACTDAKHFQGMKARVSPNAASRMFWNSLQTNGVALPLPDTWPALQTGVVDTGDLTFAYYTTTPAAKAAPHYVFTRHSHQPAFFLANQKAWESLPAAARQAVLDSMPSTAVMRKTMADDEGKTDERFRAAGGFTHHLSESQLKAFRDRVLPNQPELIASYGGRAQELFNAIVQGKQEFAAQQGKRGN